jgi:tetratricopeptide (TPR) repeat protein
MGVSVQGGEFAINREEPVEIGLSPAESRRIVRRRLKPLVEAWGLEAADPYRLTRQMQARTYRPSEIILPSGARGDFLGVVAQGQVAVHAGSRGASRLLVVLLPGSTFGETMLFEGQPSNATLQALTQTEIRFVRRADVQALRQERQVERRSSALWQLLAVSAVGLFLVIAAILALSLSPSRAVLSIIPMGIGQWCEDQRLEACAEQSWRIAAGLSPSDPNPRLALGMLNFEQGDLGVAEWYFDAVKDLTPDSPEAYNNLGLVYARRGEHERAIAAFEQALELEPGIAVTEHNLALSMQIIRAYEDSIAHYQTALALGSTQPSTLINMAIAFYEAGRKTEAVDTVRQALSRDGDSAPAYTVLGAVALDAEEPAAALPELQQAIALESDYTQAYFYLGLAYKSLGQTSNAIIAFEHALLSTDDEQTRVKIRRHLDELY